jgi:hypothetical protein
MSRAILRIDLGPMRASPLVIELPEREIAR